MFISRNLTIFVTTIHTDTELHPTRPAIPPHSATHRIPIPGFQQSQLMQILPFPVLGNKVSKSSGYQGGRNELERKSRADHRHDSRIQRHENLGRDYQHTRFRLVTEYGYRVRGTHDLDCC